jgi:glycosyltransferase involved in cell wall biosynthesis
MRILYFSRDYTTHDRRFLAKLSESSHEILFLRLYDDGIGYETRPLPAGVKAVRWKGADGTPSPEACLRAMPRFAEVLKDARPDVTHAGPIPTCAFMAALAGARPLLAMSWGSDILVEAHEDPLTAWASRFALAHADRFVVDCNAVREEIRAITSASDDRFVQLPWGLDLARFPRPAFRTVPAAEIVVLSTRSWAPIYGIETVIDAFRIAVRDEPRLRLVLVGDGPLAPHIDTKIEACGLGELIRRPGRLAEDALATYFAAADIYLSCARSDGTSISLLEAMAYGLPVVVSDAPGNREWVEPERGGWLVSAGDAVGFAAAVLRAAHLSATERFTIAQHNRGVVEERANWNRNGTRLLTTYDRLDAARTSGARE